jgi:hypothetical protein
MEIAFPRHDVHADRTFTACAHTYILYLYLYLRRHRDPKARQDASWGSVDNAAPGRGSAPPGAGSAAMAEDDSMARQTSKLHRGMVWCQSKAVGFNRRNRADRE